MPYLNVYGGFAFHRKVVGAGNAAMGLWVRCGAWTASEQEDGLIFDEIGKAIGKPAEIAALVQNRLWEPAPLGGWIMHDYDVYNITAEKAKRVSEERAKAGQRGGSARRGVSPSRAGPNGGHSP